MHTLPPSAGLPAQASLFSDEPANDVGPANDILLQPQGRRMQQQVLPMFGPGCPPPRADTRTVARPKHYRKS